MPSPAPNLAFVLLLVGVLLIYCEFIWLGRVIPGVIGALLLLYASAALWHLPHAKQSMPFLAAAILGFGLEAFVDAHRLPAILGSAMLAWSSYQIGISPALGLPASAVFGVITVTLLGVAKRARRNKRVLDPH